MAPVGLSTGALFSSNLSLQERLNLYHGVGSQGVEIMLATRDEAYRCTLSEELEKSVCRFAPVTIHAPMIGLRYNNDDDTKALLWHLGDLCKYLPIVGIVVHPDLVDDFTVLEKSGLPILIENMDRRKTCYTKPGDIERLAKDYNFGFCMDVQHIWEHDPSMVMADDMRAAMGDRLRQMHVSGCTATEIHYPTFLAENKDAIVKVLEKRITVPKVLEGLITKEPDRLKAAREELAFVRQYES